MAIRKLQWSSFIVSVFWEFEDEGTTKTAEIKREIADIDEEPELPTLKQTVEDEEVWRQEGNWWFLCGCLVV